MTFSVGDFIAGWFGGVLSLLFSYPMDTIKVRQQAYHSNLITAVKHIYKHQGFLGFYRGMFSPFLTYGPSNSLFFGVYGNSMRLLEHSNNIDHHISPAAMYRIMVAGSIAGVFQTLFYCPVEYVKILIQANTDVNIRQRKKYIPPYKNTYEAITGIYRNNGFFGFYRGFWPTFVRDAPSGGLYMLVYEILRYSTLDKIDALSNITKEVIAGGTAGIISIATVIPFDVVKTHIQTDDPKKPYFKNSSDCFSKLYKSHGVKIFFKGLPIICSRAFPAHAIMFVGYEHVISLFE